MNSNNKYINIIGNKLIFTKIFVKEFTELFNVDFKKICIKFYMDDVTNKLYVSLLKLNDVDKTIHYLKGDYEINWGRRIYTYPKYYWITTSKLPSFDYKLPPAISLKLANQSIKTKLLIEACNIKKTEYIVSVEITPLSTDNNN